MVRVCLVTPDLEHGGAAAQLALVAAGLPRDEFEARVCVLGGEGPVAERLRRADVPVDVLGGGRPLDPLASYRLRRVLSSWRPDMIHTWRPAALRLALLAAGRASPPLVASCLLRPVNGGICLGWLDSWLARQAHRVVASGDAEAGRCERLGVPAAKIMVIPPGVALPPPHTEASAPDRRFVLCVGPLHPEKGIREAVWAFDVLRRLYPDLLLVIAGSGPDLPRLQKFTAAIGLTGCVRFVGEQADIAGLLARTEAVWIPSRTDAGVGVALEAMAAGRPVVASRLPGLAEVIREGETGFLVPPGDKVALAKLSRMLLEDPGRGRELGAAGRLRVAAHFTADGLVRRFAGLYRELAA